MPITFMAKSGCARSTGGWRTSPGSDAPGDRLVALLAGSGIDTSGIQRDPATQTARDQVRFGATVEVADEDDNRRTLTLVGDDETDAAAGHIGWSAPLARALIGAKIGDERIVHLPSGEKSYEVIAISYPPAR